MIFLVWFWFSRDILAKRNKGIAIKEICTFRLAITDDQCCIVICGCGINKWYVVWVTNWGKTINHIKRDWQLFFFHLYHLWYLYAFFTYVQVKYPLGCSIFIEWYIYIYICVCVCVCVCAHVKGHVAELAPPHAQSAWGQREKRFNFRG